MTRWLRKRLNPTAFDFSGTLFLRLFFLGSAFVVRFLLARTLGAAGLGEYNYALAWIDVLLIAAVFGFDRLVVRELSAAQASQEWDIMRGLMRFASRFVLLLATVLMLAAIAITLLYTQSGGELMAEGSQWVLPAMIAAFLLLPLRALIRLRQGTMQAFGAVAPSQLPEYVVQPILFIVLLGIIWLIPQVALNPFYAMMLYLLSMLIAFAYGEFLQRKSIPSAVNSATPAYHARDWLRGALPLVLISSMQVIYSRTDVLMIGALDSAEGVGIYSIAARLATLVSLVLMAANTALGPRFARLYKAEKISELQRLVTRSTRIVTLLALLISAVLVLFGLPLLAIFGEEFTAGYTTMLIIVAGQFFNALTGSVGILLIMTGHSWQNGIGVGLSAILNILLNLWLIPIYGIEGAAVASLVSMLVTNTFAVVFVWRSVRIVPTFIGKFWVR